MKLKSELVIRKKIQCNILAQHQTLILNLAYVTSFRKILNQSHFLY